MSENIEMHEIIPTIKNIKKVQKVADVGIDEIKIELNDSYREDFTGEKQSKAEWGQLRTKLEQICCVPLAPNFNKLEWTPTFDAVYFIKLINSK